MMAVILAGGLGSRLSEETELRPKPMVEIGGRPILWHIMKIFSHHGINDFLICLGYKGYSIKEYFANYFLRTADVTFDLAANRMEVHRAAVEPWRVTLVDTGLETMTGGRLKRIAPLLPPGSFCMTYGDGVGDVDITALVAAHRAAGRLATVTAVKPQGRFGVLRLDDDRVVEFDEKVVSETDWVNGGFFVLEPEALDYVDGDQTSWEREPLERLFRAGQLGAFRHRGFWHPMDTLRDRHYLEKLWAGDAPPWRVWS